MDRGKGTGWIAWKPGRSRSRPRESKPAIGRRLNIDPGPEGTLRPSGSASASCETLLEAVYEQDFLPCSFGFRPGRSAHQALQSLHTAIMSQGLRWVVDIDIVKYFDSIPHSQLRDFLDRRYEYMSYALAVSL